VSSQQALLVIFALIQRGTIDFATKVTNAMNAGATAAIIYNNAAGDFTGTLGAAGNWIPAVSVSDTTGAAS
jgi:bisphosphoglycerate-independent phosphoglycerate mutase (AlkP superfamily)